MKRVCYVITSRTQYGRSKILLKALNEHPDINLTIIVAGSALHAKYGEVTESIENDGMKVGEKITMLIEGGSPVAMAKTTGLGLIEFATVFENLKPDIVLIRGDRYEMMAATIAASYLNIVIAHIEGGDVSGTIDESVRHAITKLSHIHFPTNKLAYDRIVRMGENPEHVHLIGSLDVEYLTHFDLEKKSKFSNLEKIGLGPKINYDEPYLVVLQHPVTTEYGQGRKNFEQTIKAVEQFEMPIIWFWPNIDAGSDEISKSLRVSRETGRLGHVHFFRSLPPDVFIQLINQSACLIGNSSAGIKECSYLGVPVVNIGTRQEGRLRAKNVMNAPYDAIEIKKAIEKQIASGRYEMSKIYLQDNTSKQLTEILVSRSVNIQKKWFD